LFRNNLKKTFNIIQMANLKVNSLFVHVAAGVDIAKVKASAYANPSKIYLCADGTIINGKGSTSADDVTEYGYNSTAKADVANLKAVLKSFLPEDTTVTEDAVATAIEEAKEAAIKTITDYATAGNALQVSIDGETTKFDSALTLKYVAGTADKAAHIDLLDKNEEALGTVEVSDIIGNGVLKSTSYDASTGILTLTFSTVNGGEETAEVNLKEMLDLGDLMVADGSKSYLDIQQVVKDGTDIPDEDQLSFAVLIKKLADATDAETGLVDAKDAKDYIDAAVNISAEGDDYVNASYADKKVSISATDSTKASLALADTSVQEVAGSDYVSATVDNSATNKTYKVDAKVSTDFSTLADDSKLLADAKTTKAYVDAKVALVADALVATVTTTTDDDKATAGYAAGIKVVNGVSDSKVTSFISATDLVNMVDSAEYWDEYTEA
jgi:hypothetical protein